MLGSAGFVLLLWLGTASPSSESLTFPIYATGFERMWSAWVHTLAFLCLMGASGTEAGAF